MFYEIDWQSGWMIMKKLLKPKPDSQRDILPYMCIYIYIYISAIIEKYLNGKGGKLYVAFIDMRKVFDSVDCASLFLTVVKAGLSGLFLNAIKAMYRSVISYVRVHNKVTAFFDCPFGVKQVCILSPVLFSLFVNEIVTGMEAVRKHGIQLQPGLVELFLLLFADDLVLLSSTAMGLQNNWTIWIQCVKNTPCPSILKSRKSWYSEKVGFSAKMKSGF